VTVEQDDREPDITEYDEPDLGPATACYPAKPVERPMTTPRAAVRGGRKIHGTKFPIFFRRRFKSEVQQCSIDEMAERTAGEKVGVKGFSRRRRCELSEHP
jgi:hypothetical protein